MKSSRWIPVIGQFGDMSGYICRDCGRAACICERNAWLKHHIEEARRDLIARGLIETEGK